MRTEDHHQRKLNEIRVKLGLFPANEHSFFQMELLFFQALRFIYECKYTSADQDLLKQASLLKEKEYQILKHNDLAEKNRVKAIHKFKASFKRLLQAALRKKEQAVILGFDPPFEINLKAKELKI